MEKSREEIRADFKALSKDLEPKELLLVLTAFGMGIDMGRAISAEVRKEPESGEKQIKVGEDA